MMEEAKLRSEIESIIRESKRNDSRQERVESDCPLFNLN